MLPHNLNHFRIWNHSSAFANLANIYQFIGSTNSDKQTDSPCKWLLYFTKCIKSNYYFLVQQYGCLFCMFIRYSRYFFL